MNKVLDKFNNKNDYFDILGGVPDFFLDYIYTEEMQKQDQISVTSGTAYTNMTDSKIWYSSLDHSIAVGTIIWHFTHDKKQALAGLFHDIATPTFKHTIDFFNNDSSTQESTEKNTSKIINNSTEIMELLNRDGIKLEEVDNYHLYPIADNDSPKLSADRLEYTLSNSLGVVKELATLEDIKTIYDDIIIGYSENGEPELCFNTLKNAEKFVFIMSELSKIYIDPEHKFSMQFLSDIIKTLIETKSITIADLYNKSDKEMIDIISNNNVFNISKAFDIWKKSEKAYESDFYITGKYNVSINPKHRYIDPLVYNEDINIYERISSISNISKDKIEEAKNYKTKKYIYSNFNF